MSSKAFNSSSNPIEITSWNDEGSAANPSIRLPSLDGGNTTNENAITNVFKKAKVLYNTGQYLTALKLCEQVKPAYPISCFFL